MRFPISKGMAVLIPMLIVQACTTRLAVDQIGAGAQSGIVYALPLTQFDISVTRRITKCEIGKMSVLTEIAVEKAVIEDPAAVFVIQPESLSHFFNTASTNVDFYPGTRFLKTFNASVSDSAGPAIGSVIKAIGGVVAVGAAAGGDDAEVCDNRLGIPDAVSAASNQQSVLESLTEKVETQTVFLARLKSAQADLLPGRTDEMDEKVAIAVTQLKSASTQLAAEKDLLERLLKPITYVQKTKWPTDGKSLVRAEPIRMPDDALAKWVGKSGVTPQQTEALDIHVRIEADNPAAREPGNPEADRLADPPGVFYRSPSSGRVLFEAGGPLPRKQVFVHPDTIAQLGFINSLPVTAGPFESVEYEAGFALDGSLIKAGYKRTKAPADSAVSIVDALSAQYVAVETAKRESDQKTLDRDLKRLQTERLIEEEKVKANPPDPDEDVAALEAMTTRTALINAEIALRVAQQRLEDFSADD